MSEIECPKEERIKIEIEKRKMELINYYDGELEQINIELKNKNNRLEEASSQEIEKQIKIETKELVDKQKELNEELKKLYKEKKIPFICQTPIYSALFMPGTLVDVGIIILTLIFYLFVFPNAIYSSLFHRQGNWKLIIIYIVLVIIEFLIYAVIADRTRSVYIQALKDARQLRIEINKLKREAIKKTKKIEREKEISAKKEIHSEKEIEKLKEKSSQIKKEKEKALRVFKETTVKEIEEEIKTKTQKE